MSVVIFNFITTDYEYEYKVDESIGFNKLVKSFTLTKDNRGAATIKSVKNYSNNTIEFNFVPDKNCPIITGYFKENIFRYNLSLENKKHYSPDEIENCLNKTIIIIKYKLDSIYNTYLEQKQKLKSWNSLQNI